MPLLTKKTEVEALVAAARKSGYCAVDTETSGLDWTRCHIAGASFCFDGETGYYVRGDLIACLGPLLGDKKVVKSGHNIKFDLHFLRKFGLKTAGIVYDTEVMSRVLDENRFNHKLKDLCVALLGEKKEEQEALKAWMKEAGIEDYSKVPVEIMAPYACKDAVLAHRLFHYLKKALEDQDAAFDYPETLMSLWSLVEREAKITRIAERMEQTGLPVDVTFLEEYKHRLEKEAADLAAQLRAAFNDPNLNPESDDQVGEAMKKLGWIANEKTPTGKPKVDKFALEAWEHPISQILQDYRRVSKLASTYCQGILERATDGVLHPDFRTNGAVTGRFSCSNPNMQNVDKKSEARKAFTVRPGYTNFYLDFKQIEICIFAYYAGDKIMQDTLWEGADYHKLNATAMYQIPEAAVTPEQRDKAKTFNFALLYGAGEKKIAKMLKVDYPEAAMYKKRYMDKFPSVRKLRWKCENAIRERGFIINRLGRRRRLTSEECYKSMNALIQSCAADLLKEALVRLDAALAPYGDEAAVLLQIHDELVLQIKDGPRQLDILDAAVKAMTSVGDLVPTVPIRVDVKASKTNWYEKKEHHANANLPAMHGGGVE